MFYRYRVGGKARLGVQSKPIIVKRTGKKHWLLKDGTFP
jgi:hypothetical protein